MERERERIRTWDRETCRDSRTLVSRCRPRRGCGRSCALPNTSATWTQFRQRDKPSSPPASPAPVSPAAGRLQCIGRDRSAGTSGEAYGPSARWSATAREATMGAPAAATAPSSAFERPYCPRIASWRRRWRRGENWRASQWREW